MLVFEILAVKTGFLSTAERIRKYIQGKCVVMRFSLSYMNMRSFTLINGKILRKVFSLKQKKSYIAVPM